MTVAADDPAARTVGPYAEIAAKSLENGNKA